MNRDGQEGGKEDLASVVLEEIQDQVSIDFRKDQCCFGFSSSSKAARSSAACSLALAARGDCPLQPRSPQARSDTHWDSCPFIQTDLKFLFIAQSPGLKKKIKMLIYRKILEFPFWRLLHKDLNIIIKPTLYTLLSALCTFSPH